MPKPLEHVGGTLDAIVRWLVFEASPTASTAELLHEFAGRLCAAGLELIRLNLQMRPLSPQAAAVLYLWRPGPQGGDPSAAPTLDLRNPALLANVVGEEHHSLDGGRVQITALAHGVLETTPYRASPIFPLTVGADVEVRRRIAPHQVDFDFPILKDLQAQDATDYLAFQVRLHDGAPSAISFATRKAGGFSDSEIAFLRQACRPLVLALSPRFASRTLRTLLGAYLGPKTADFVLAGTIERGDVTEIEAAIWFSDLRGFTPMSATISSTELIAWLNEYFAAVGRAIVRHDGEILKFIGDAILAVWPVSDSGSREATCRAALAAAREANRELDALNVERLRAGLPVMQHGIGLHIGSAQYGNIGAEGRLDFTVIGQAVNTASRLESVCAKLSRRVVASAEFAGLCGADLVSLGATTLKGVDGPREVFGIDEG
jgi:adenylate cyclase